MRPPLSAVIITYNAGRTLQRCLSSIAEVIEDIIIVDAESTDDTKAIAARYTERIYSKKWTGYGAARNYGASLATHEWIFAIDSDECLDQKLRSSLHSMIPHRKTLYAIKRVNYVGEKPFRFGELSPSFKIKLYHRQEAEWNNAPVHETLSYAHDLVTMPLHGRIDHFAYLDLDDMKKRYQQYAQLAYQPSLIFAILSPIYHFIKTYMFKLGFLEGHMGWVCSVIRASYARRKYKP